MPDVIDEIHCYVICPFCKAHNDLIVRLDGFRAWKAGTIISVAFPELSPEKRELLMTGICGNCFPKDEDDGY